jgi:hypothetical protein
LPKIVSPYSNSVMLGLLVAIIRGYTMLYYAILPFVYPTNSSV